MLIHWNELIKASEARALIPTLTAAQKAILGCLDGDYWQRGTQWTGIQIPSDAVERDAQVAEQEKVFVPQPLIGELTDGFVNGVVGDEPSFEFALARPLGKKGDVVDGAVLEEDEAPTPAESKLLGEINAASGAWFDKRNGHEAVQDFAENLVVAGRGGLRYFVPPGMLDDLADGGKKLSVRDWAAALDAIYLECPPLDSATLAIDPATRQQVSVFSYLHIDRSSGKPVEKQRVEVSFIDAAGKTVVRILEDDVIVEGGEAVQDTGGELYYDEARLRRPYLTEAMLRCNNAINVLNTMMLANGNIAGNRSVDYFNVQPPQREIIDPGDPAKKKLVPDVIEQGPGSRNLWAGIVYTDNEGNQKLANGSMVVTNPVDPKPLIDAIERFERNMYQAGRQAHVMMSSDSTASAVSRVQARALFVEVLKKLKAKIEGVLRSRLRGAVLLACYLANDTERLKAVKDTLRVNVNCRINPGPLTPEERQAIVALYEAGIIPLEDAQIMLGIEDVEAIAQKLRAEVGDTLRLTPLERAQMVQALTAAGAPLKDAALAAGFDEETANSLGQSQEEPV